MKSKASEHKPRGAARANARHAVVQRRHDSPVQKPHTANPVGNRALGRIAQLSPDDAGKDGGRPSAAPASEINRTGMPDALKSGIESMSGLDMSDVRVHTNSDKPAQLGAHAYAQGRDIHLGPGQERHLPHEAWHVVQQAQGRVRPTLQTAGVPINDDKGLEREADVMGAKAAQMRQDDSGHGASPDIDAAAAGRPGPVQRVGPDGTFHDDIEEGHGFITVSVDNRNFGHTYIIGETPGGVWMFHFRADAPTAPQQVAKLIAWSGTFEEIAQVDGHGHTPQTFVAGRNMLHTELGVTAAKVDEIEQLCRDEIGQGTFSLLGANVRLGENCISKVYNILKQAGITFTWSTYLASFLSPRAAVAFGAGLEEVHSHGE